MADLSIPIKSKIGLNFPDFPDTMYKTCSRSSYSQVYEAAQEHSESWAQNADETRRQPVAQGKHCVDDGQAGVPIASERGVVPCYAV